MEMVLLITGSSIIHRKLCVATTFINFHALGRSFNQFPLNSTHTQEQRGAVTYSTQHPKICLRLLLKTKTFFSNIIDHITETTKWVFLILQHRMMPGTNIRQNNRVITNDQTFGIGR